ncbi:MAG: RNA polymerase sigma factor [Bacteroidales bacterium]
MNEDQFKQLVVPLSNRLFALCRRILGSSDEAKDCLQDVLVKLWINRSNLTEIKSIEAYAITIARNKSLDRIKARKENVSIDGFELKSDDSSVNIKEFEHNQRVQLIKNAISKLNNLQQKVFVMRDFEQMDFNDIATELSISEENARVTLSRARKSIRKLIVEKTMKKKAAV